MVLASIAVHLAGVVLPALLVPIYAIVAGAESAGGFAGLVSTWSLPVLTLPAALWAARGARQRETLVGLLVGALVAGMLGVLFFPPADLRSLALFALIVVAGLAGGLLAKRRP